MSEFNQCQTQLITLYEEIEGGHKYEFLSYLIYYFIHIDSVSGILDYICRYESIDRQIDS